MATLLEKSIIALLLLLLLVTASGCGRIAAVEDSTPSIAELPENLKFYISPDKEYYLPYERVTLNLTVKDNGSLEKDLHLNKDDQFKVKFTPLTLVNGQPTYNVKWKGIHRNLQGIAGRGNYGITWYPTNNWSEIISQEQQKNTIQFVIGSTLGYWKTDIFTINIHVPLEEQAPYIDLLETGVSDFFEYEYAIRAYNSNWSTYWQCPPNKLPYDALSVFMKKYPHSSFTHALKLKLIKTRKSIKNEYTKYDKGDMREIENLLIELGVDLV